MPSLETLYKDIEGKLNAVDICAFLLYNGFYKFEEENKLVHVCGNGITVSMAKFIFSELNSPKEIEWHFGMPNHRIAYNTYFLLHKTNRLNLCLYCKEIKSGNTIVGFSREEIEAIMYKQR